MKTCPKCGSEWPDTGRFCPECGVRLVEKGSDKPAPAPGVRIQDGVVTGGVHITSTDSRTIINQQDSSREVLTCAKCGANVLRPEGFTCPLCSRFFCSSDYEKQQKACRDCMEFRVHAASNQYRTLLDEAMRDGRIDPAERARLERACVELGLSPELCARLESESRGQGVLKAPDLGRREQALLEEARRLLFENFAAEEAFKIIAPLFERHSENPEIRRIYLLAVVEVDPDKGMKTVESMRFDDFDKSLACIELHSRRGDFDKAYDVLKDAQRAFGADNSELIACETELAVEEYRRTGRKALLDLAADSLGRLKRDGREYVAFVHSFFSFVKGEKQALDGLEQAGNFYARRKKRFISGQAGKDPEPKAAPQQGPATNFIPIPSPVVLQPGTWRIMLVDAWGQRYHGSCDVMLSGPNVNLMANYSGQPMLPDGLMHFLQERSIYRGSVAGTNLAATCTELVRMIDGFVVPVPGLPIRLNAIIGNNGRSLEGTLVNMMGESARIFMNI